MRSATPTRVLPLPVKIAGEIRKQNPHFKPFVAARFLAEMLAEIKWTDETKLQLTIEKDGLKITASDLGIENFTTNELVYVPLWRGRFVTETERIIDQLKRAFDGEPWYGTSLSGILTDVAAQTAATRLFPDALSIWELVLHLTFTENIMRRRLEGEAAEFSDREDFPSVEDISEAAWQETLEKLTDSHRKLVATISSLADAQLNQTVTGRDHSKYFLLHGLIQHLVYHAGQIALLKKSASPAKLMSFQCGLNSRQTSSPLK